MMVPLRRSLETDRFGFVAYVLAIRDGCTAQNCKTLSLFRDANRVRTNLTTAALERYLEHYAAAWSAPEVPLAEATQAPTGSTAAAAGQGSRKIVNIDFPSASSIPAVSIMNPGTDRPGSAGRGGGAAANPNPSAPAQRHARKQSSPNPNAAAPNPNATLAGQSGQPAVEPIWPEPMPQAPPARGRLPKGRPTAPHPRRRPPVRFSSRRPRSMPVLVRLLARSERGADHPLPFTSSQMFNSVLIANRGEIACRIARTAKRLGMRTIAVYSAADARRPASAALRRSLFHRSGAEPRESYLSIERLIEAAQESAAPNAFIRATGFLSENGGFRRSLRKGRPCIRRAAGRGDPRHGAEGSRQGADGEGRRADRARLSRRTAGRRNSSRRTPTRSAIRC